MPARTLRRLKVATNRPIASAPHQSRTQPHSLLRHKSTHSPENGGSYDRINVGLLPFLLGVTLLGGCPTAETGGGVNESGDDGNQVDLATRMTLPEVRFWAYQIQQIEADGSVDALVESSYDLVVLEPTRYDRGNTDFDTVGMVERLHESPASSPNRTKLVVAYIDIGQAEDWRTYWGADWVAPASDAIGSPDFLITIDPDGRAGNYPVAYWDERLKQIMIDGDNSVLQQILDDGFDGIYMDWVEAYSDTSVMAAADGEGLNLAQEMIDFISEIRQFARAQNPDFLIIPQNAAEILEFGGQAYLDIIDGIAQDQIYFDGNADTDRDEPDSDDHRVQDACRADDSECGYSRAFYEGWLEEYLNANKRVLCVDYAGEADNAAEAYQNAAANGYIPYVSRPLDRLTDMLPPGYAEWTTFERRCFGSQTYVPAELFANDLAGELEMGTDTRSLSMTDNRAALRTFSPVDAIGHTLSRRAGRLT